MASLRSHPLLYYYSPREDPDTVTILNATAPFLPDHPEPAVPGTVESEITPQNLLCDRSGGLEWQRDDEYEGPDCSLVNALIMSPGPMLLVKTRGIKGLSTS